jgi:GNAT superfamily N-acetyltransferase
MIRRAGRADLDRLCRTGMRAFEHDPLVRWLIPDDEAYATWQGECLFRSIFRWWGEMGEVWMTDDGVAVSAWGPPTVGEPPEALLAELGELRAAHPPEMHERTALLQETMRAHRPSEPHWYLNILATHPDWQRQGLGLAVMEDVRRRCDEDGLGQYLETATDEDVAYYRGRGFEVTARWIVDNSVTLTGMWRAPGAGNR